MTVGGAQLVAVETAPGQHADEVLRLAASLEQASHHVVAAAIVAAAVTRGLSLTPPSEVGETMGAGLEGRIAGRLVKAGLRQLVFGGGQLEAWAVRALRRASWRYPDIGRGQRRSVINPVANHEGRMQPLLVDDGFDLVRGLSVGEHRIDVERRADRFSRLGPVARDHDDAPHAGGSQRLHSQRCLAPELIGEQDGADDAAVEGNQDAERGTHPRGQRARRTRYRRT